MRRVEDAALEAFDRLRVREVTSGYEDAASFLARFQSIAASLGPDERIKLNVGSAHVTLELLKAVLADPQADKIFALHWQYNGKKDVNSIVPLLLSNCPELALLWVNFEHRFELDFISSVLEHPGNKVKVLEVPRNTKGDLPRFFAALGQSQVSALTLHGLGSPELCQRWCRYLAKDLLVRLHVSVGNNQVPSEVMMSLADCTRLVELKVWNCEFFQPTAFTHLPKSITKLVLEDGTFADGFDWSFLAGSNVRELGFVLVKGVDGNQFGGALAVLLREKGLEKLSLDTNSFTNDTLAAVGAELGRIKRLNLEDSGLNDASFELIARVLQSPNNEMKELVMYKDDAMSCIENHLVPALRHPNCNLAELDFWGEAKTITDAFHNRRALFLLLQGQQVRRLYCPLRRLPVEMFRLVGQVLI